MSHLCHAMYCEVPVPPENLMCKHHWFLVPPYIRSQVWSTYRSGQCDDMRPSGSWMIAAERAICAVAVKEGVLTKEQADKRLAKEIDRFARNSRTPPTRLINIRGTDHRGNHVYIGRGSPFGNPFSHTSDTKYRTIQVDSREQAIASYRMWLNGDDQLEGWPKPTHDQIMALRGRSLACFCTPLPCHGEVLIDYIEGSDDEEPGEDSVDVSGVSPPVVVSSDASPSSIITEGSGGGTDLRRGAVLIGSEKPEVQSGNLTRSETASSEKGHQAGTADPVPLTSMELRLQPFIRWPGGKRWLVNQLVPKIIADKPKLYVEPFLGAGAIALALPKTIPMLLTDYSEPLINLWKHVQRTPHLVGAAARACLENLGNDREGYYLAREHFNSLTASFDDDGAPIDALERAALMLYLNATNYNGVWRENKRGGYNVPFGSVKQAAICSIDELLAISSHLGAAKLMWCDFADVIKSLTDEEITCTVIYADPPYHSGFDDYIAGGFPDVEHERLAEVLFDAADRGACVYTTNADTELIRRLYKDAISIEPVMELRNVAQKPDSRKAVGCLLIEI